MPNIQIEKEYDDMLNLLKDRLGMSKKAVVEKAIVYIYKNKINPEFIKQGDPIAEIKQLRNELIGFIKTQEKNKLDPMLHKLAVLADKMFEKATEGGTSDSLKKDIGQINTNYNKMAEYLNRLNENTNKNAPILSRQMADLKNQLDGLSKIVEEKLSKKSL